MDHMLAALFSSTFLLHFKLGLFSAYLYTIYKYIYTLCGCVMELLMHKTVVNDRNESHSNSGRLEHDSSVFGEVAAGASDY